MRSGHFWNLRRGISFLHASLDKFVCFRGDRLRRLWFDGEYFDVRLWRSGVVRAQ